MERKVFPRSEVKSALSIPTVMQAKLRDYVLNSRSENTLRAYRSDWQDFVRWSELHHRPFLPASEETVSLYLAELAEQGRKASTLQRRLSSISVAHTAKGLDSPTHSQTVRSVWRGIRRAYGSAQVGKEPVLMEDLRRMAQSLPNTRMGLRDRALLLLGFAGAFRRSELVGLDWSDLEFRQEGLKVTIRRSKTDPEGVGRAVGIPYGAHLQTCPVRTLQEWLEQAEIAEGPVFRRVFKNDRVGERRLSDKTVALIVKKAASLAGMDPTPYAGHSLRSGLATSAARAGASERAIMAQTGHRSVHMVRRYIREGSLFRENAAAQVGM